MATKYEEMSDTGKNWAGRRQRSRQHAVTLINGLREYCQIPMEKIRFLRWDGVDAPELTYREPPEDGHRYSVVGALVFDEVGGGWRIGVRITFSDTEIFIPLCVSERGGKPSVTVGDAKETQIDFSDVAECSKFYESVVDRIKQSFGEGQGSKIGFKVNAATANAAEVGS